MDFFSIRTGSPKENFWASLKQVESTVKLSPQEGSIRRAFDNLRSSPVEGSGASFASGLSRMTPPLRELSLDKELCSILLDKVDEALQQGDLLAAHNIASSMARGEGGQRGLDKIYCHLKTEQGKLQFLKLSEDDKTIVSSVTESLDATMEAHQKQIEQLLIQKKPIDALFVINSLPSGIVQDACKEIFFVWGTSQKKDSLPKEVREAVDNYYIKDILQQRREVVQALRKGNFDQFLSCMKRLPEGTEQRKLVLSGFGDRYLVSVMQIENAAQKDQMLLCLSEGEGDFDKAVSMIVAIQDGEVQRGAMIALIGRVLSLTDAEIVSYQIQDSVTRTFARVQDKENIMPKVLQEVDASKKDPETFRTEVKKMLFDSLERLRLPSSKPELLSSIIAQEKSKASRHIKGSSAWHTCQKIITEAKQELEK
ncbi:MAG: hypothetical protein FJZ58_04135 [Chlamydiae bacterium]|nr:hypothetical protein [Chlamydiota bacterium]